MNLISQSLPGAMTGFVSHPTHNDRSKMNVNVWADTFHVSAEMIRSEWEAAMTRHSRSQNHNGEVVE